MQLSGAFASVGSLVDVRMETDPEVKVRYHTMKENPLADPGRLCGHFRKPSLVA